MMGKVDMVSKSYERKEVPAFSVGDTVKVAVKIREEDKFRIQMFEGLVIKKRGKGISSSFTVRRVSSGEGIERTFPMHSPSIDKVTVVKSSNPHRAKLYYMRKKVGKKADVVS
jgi:large subunit ribosomal protein L19